jgi:DNA-binding NarL/FixJ family response regulator
VVDVYPLFRAGVVQAISRADNLVVVGEGSSANDAVTIAPKCNVLLLEAAVPGSLDVVKTIQRSSPETKIVFLCAIEDDEHADCALRLGVHGYLVKGVTGPELVNALTAVHLGTCQIGAELVWRLLAQSRAVAPLRAEPLFLNVREQQILDHTARGLTNAQMAGLLGLSISAIKRYKTSLFRRMGVRNRVEAIIAAGNRAKPEST